MNIKRLGRMSWVSEKVEVKVECGLWEVIGVLWESGT